LILSVNLIFIVIVVVVVVVVVVNLGFAFSSRPKKLEAGKGRLTQVAWV